MFIQFKNERINIITLKNQSRLGFGTKILNHKTNEIGLLIYTWDNTFADGDVPFATCVDKDGNGNII